MRKIRKMIAVMLTAVLLFSLCGCTAMKSGRGKIKLQRHMKDKYGEEFEITDSNLTDGSVYVATVRPKSDPDLVFVAEYERQKRKDVYYDDYIPAKILAGMSKRCEELMTGYGGELFVSVSNNLYHSYCDDTVDTPEKLQELNPDGVFYISILAENTGDLKTIYDQMLSIKAEYRSLNGLIELYMLPKESIQTIREDFKDKPSGIELTDEQYANSEIYRMDMGPDSADPAYEDFLQSRVDNTKPLIN